MLKGPPFSEKLTRALDLPANSIAGAPTVEIISNMRVRAEGLDRIIHYDGELIQLSCKTHSVRITGSDLIISSFDNQEIIIDGFIAAVEFL